jgi:hypothetical protein
MRDLANAMRLPDEVVPASKVTVSAPEPEMAGMDKPFVGTRLNVPKPGQPTQQDREKMAVGLLDTLAGALRGAAAQVGGLPGDIRSILDMINQEGAEKYLGQRSFATTEEILADTSVRIPGTRIDVPFPPVLKEGVPNRAERQKAVDVAQEVGTFLPAPGAPEAAIQGGKLIGKAIKATKNMPVGMSTQAVGQGMDELGFYSAAKQAVDAIQQPKGTGAQFLAQISKTPGVKPDEIKWTGLDEFLQSKKSVTKAEVQEYLDKNRVQIKEVTLGMPNESKAAAQTADDIREILEAGQVMDDDAANFIERYLAARSAGNRNSQAESSLEEYLRNAGDMRTIDEIEQISKEMADSSKFSKYTLPGGENYREILLTLPSKSPEFKSQHFDQPNILAHLRVNDRVIDGKKTLFVEEVQSDWHQAGRKKGYSSPGMEEANRQSVIKAKNEFRNYEKTLAEKYGLPPKMTATASIKDRMNWQGNLLTTISDEEKAVRSGLEDKIKSAEQTWAASTKGVPDAPFKTTWSDLSMKRVIQMASEGGYDRIAFTTGKTQAKRYDLGNEVDELLVTKNDNGTFYIEASLKGGRGIETVGEDISPDKLESFVGKDLATKIRKQESKGDIYDGNDLEVGGEGMKGFYDDILPKFLDKYAKKWDAKTGVTSLITDDVKFQEFYSWALTKDKSKSYTSIQSSFKNKDNLYKEFATQLPIKGDEVRYIDVTPKMRESVVTKGQPMFAIGAGGAGAAATQEENE